MTVGPLVGSRVGDAYLDLLKRCLTRTLFEGEDFREVMPLRGTAKHAVWSPVRRLLARRGFVFARRGDRDLEAAAQGREWSAHGETMIGLARLDNVQQCVADVIRNDVPGDLVEAGVWRGGAAILMRAALLALGDTDRLVWVADSFAGLPKPLPGDGPDTGDEHWTFAQLAVPLEEVKANFARYGLLDERVRFLPGWFSETLPASPIERIAVLRIDADMYRSTLDALEALYPRVAPGGFVIIDDYSSHAPCATGVDEYRAANGIGEPLREIDWAGVYWQKDSTTPGGAGG